MAIDVGMKRLDHGGDVVDVVAECRSYAEAVILTERIFSAAAALWPHDHDAHIGDDADDAPPPARGRVADAIREVKPGSAAEKVLNAWMGGARTREALCEQTGLSAGVVGMLFSKLQRGGLIDGEAE